MKRFVSDGVSHVLSSGLLMATETTVEGELETTYTFQHALFQQYLAGEYLVSLTNVPLYILLNMKDLNH